MKVLIFDLFDTILHYSSFDFNLLLQKLHTQYIDPKNSFEDLQNYAKKYREQYMADRSTTHKEVSFIHQLEFYQKELGFNDNYNLYDLELDLMLSCRKEIIRQDTIPTLEYFKKWGYKLYIMSNSIFSAITLTKYLETFKLATYFDGIYSSADCGYRKPHLDFFSYFQVTTDIPLNKEIYFIGNTYKNDVMGAKNAKLTPVYYQEEGDIVEGVYTITTLKDLVDLFQNKYIYINTIMEKFSTVDGPGMRSVVFLQGCAIQCEGCHNEASWDRANNSRISIEELSTILKNKSVNKKITISGGEPLLQSLSLLRLLESLDTYDICLYTSYEEHFVPSSIKEKLTHLKVGKYEHCKRTSSTPYIGSTNQKFINLRESL